MRVDVRDVFQRKPKVVGGKFTAVVAVDPKRMSALHKRRVESPAGRGQRCLSGCKAFEVAEECKRIDGPD